MSAAARNSYRSACVAFGNWCLRTNRLTGNPFADLPKADERADPQRQRRAMTETELTRFLDVALRRPLLDAMTVRRGKNKGRAIAQLRDTTKRRLMLLGWERALIYKSLVLTGLRKSELASLTIGSQELNGQVGYAVLHARDEKNRQGSELPLRADLVVDLRQWLAHKLETLQEELTRSGESVTTDLIAKTPLFNIPTGLVRILDRDLKLAKIPKRDHRGRTLDVHALRTTFGTHLSKGGVPLRIAQEAMRHSNPTLTANVYTDPALLDVAGSLDVLPALPINAQRETEIQRATGTDGGVEKFAPGFAPNPDSTCISESIPDKIAERARSEVK